MDIGYFLTLGKKLRAWLDGDLTWTAMDEAVELSFADNHWFTPYMQRRAIDTLCTYFMDRGKVDAWLAQYPQVQRNVVSTPLRCGIVMAGNIPLVGFHDFMCAVASGYTPVVKLSSKDKRLFPVLFPETEYVDTLPSKGLDALITMGGDAAASFFSTQFSEIPSLIRGSRYSCAVLSGNETSGQLEALAQDMLLYFGLGCRSVSMLLVPEGYDFSKLMEAANLFAGKVETQPFHSIYLKNRAVMLIDGIPFKDSGHITFLEMPQGHQVPISSVGYTYYSSKEQITRYRVKNMEHIQKFFTNFGFAQRPSLDDYPDEKDTMKFLSDSQLRKK